MTIKTELFQPAITQIRPFNAQSVRSGAKSTQVFTEVLDARAEASKGKNIERGLDEYRPDASGRSDPSKPFPDTSLVVQSTELDGSGKVPGEESDPGAGRSKEKEAESSRMARERRLREEEQGDERVPVSNTQESELAPVGPIPTGPTVDVLPLNPSGESDLLTPGADFKPEVKNIDTVDTSADTSPSPEIKPITPTDNLIPGISQTPGINPLKGPGKAPKGPEVLGAPRPQVNEATITQIGPDPVDKGESPFGDVVVDVFKGKPADKNELIPGTPPTKPDAKPVSNPDAKPETKPSAESAAQSIPAAAVIPPAIRAVLDRIATARSLVSSSPVGVAQASSSPAGVSAVSSADSGSIGQDANDSPKLGVIKQTATTMQRDRAAVMAQVQRGLASILRTSGGSMTLRLSPGHLGDLKIRVSTEDGAVRVRFETESAGARDAIEQGLKGLREQLEAKGVRVQELNVDHRDSSGFGASLEQQNTQTDQQDSKASRSDGASETIGTKDAADTTETNEPQSVWTELGLDTVA
ncbi:MAG: flagellar hook-length control protein FliK [Phycisphaerales bacterium]|nr:flagellar hook-length control protein FliK [Phycisphaerales bacterium]